MMENPARHKWNRHWRERRGRVEEPDSWLQRALPLLPAAGRALDLAGGAGRNALWLAELGWRVTVVDIAEEGLSLLSEEAARRGAPVSVQHCDLEAGFCAPDGPFDLVLLFFYLHRPLLPALCDAVAPGGVAVVRTFSSAGDFPEGPGNPAYALEPGELLRLFDEWEILLHEEGLEPAKRGGSLAGIVARRPEAQARTTGASPCA